MNTPKLTKRQRRLLGPQQPEDTTTFKSHFRMQPLNALTKNQGVTISHYNNGDQLLLGGTAGTGKTYLALALALQDVMAGDTEQKSVTVIRSVVPTRDVGFLPGTEADKAAVYEAPYIAICTELFGRADAYQILKTKGVLRFMSSSFVRGTTLLDTIVIVDEFQNMTSHELHSVFTRIGHGCRVVFCGDLRQNDLGSKRSETSGFSDFLRIIDDMDEFKIVTFTRDDVVRSKLVKSYILARDQLEEDGLIKAL